MYFNNLARLSSIVAAAAIGCSEASAPTATTGADQPPAAAVPVTRGSFERRLPLTGEIDAVSALELKVPRVPNGKVPVRYLAPEGTEVKPGDVVVELDSSSFVLEVKDRALQLSQAEI